MSRRNDDSCGGFSAAESVYPVHTATWRGWWSHRGLPERRLDKVDRGATVGDVVQPVR